VISISDHVHAVAGRWARAESSRSPLYPELAAESARHGAEVAAEAINRVCKTLDPRPDPALAAAGQRRSS